MSIRLFLYQVIFWLFIFGKYYYYFAAADHEQRIYITLIVVLFNMSIFYLNFYLLITKLLKRKAIFVLSQILALLCFLGLYYITDTALSIYGQFGLDAVLALTLNYITYSIYAFLYWYVVRYLKEKEQSLKLQNEKLVAEMKALKSQVSPHFLFNSLNNIYSLCLTNPDDAAQMTDKLSEQLRYLIYQGSRDKVLLKDEIKLIKDYIEIQNIKKQKGAIRLLLNLDKNGKHTEIIPLILITLVENAFTHGDISINLDSYVEIELKTIDSTIEFSVRNSFDERYKKAKEQRGIGIQNLRNQLEIEYPDCHSFVAEKSDDTYEVKLTIWMLKK